MNNICLCIFLGLILIVMIVFLIIYIIRGRKRDKIEKYLVPKIFPVRGNAFKDKIVLVTGGTSGIGLATAIAFAAEGAKQVIVCGRFEDRWKTAQKQIIHTIGTHAPIEYRPCDVRIEDQVILLMKYIIGKFGRLDIAVNNAGIATGASVGNQTLSQSSDDITNAINYFLPSPEGKGKKCSTGQQGVVNADTCENPIFTDGFGVFYCMKHEIGIMRKSGGTIVNTASVNSFWGSPGGAFYSVAKSMVLLLTRSAAVTEIQKDPPIRINCVAPGAVNTPLMRKQYLSTMSEQAYNKAGSIGNPTGRLAEPEEIAQAILYLADDARSSFVVGTALFVDGGMTAAPCLGHCQPPPPPPPPPPPQLPQLPLQPLLQPSITHFPYSPLLKYSPTSAPLY